METNDIKIHVATIIKPLNLIKKREREIENRERSTRSIGTREGKACRRKGK